MGSVESLQAMFERQLIRELVRAIAHATSEDERTRHQDALRHLVQRADPSLDVDALDPWTRAYFTRTGLSLGTSRVGRQTHDH